MPACFRGGVGFESWPLETLKIIPSAAMSTNVDSRQNALVLKKAQLIICTVRTLKQSLSNQRVGCLFDVT